MATSHSTRYDRTSHTDGGGTTSHRSPCTRRIRPRSAVPTCRWRRFRDRSLGVVLDDVRGPRPCLVRILAELAPRLALPQQVIALVELDTDDLEPLLVVG